MRTLLPPPMLCALLVSIMALSTRATVFFSDNLTSGSTLNQPPAAPTINFTSYQTAIGLTNADSNPALSPGQLTVVFPITSSVLGETFARFANTPVGLVQVGDYVELTVVFINTSNVLSGPLTGTGSTLNIGLFNSGGAAPNQGQISLRDGNTTGGTEDWVGYASRIFKSGNATIFTRPAQTPSGTTSQNQDLLFTGASGTQAFNNPAGTSLGSTASAVTLGQGDTNTLYLRITLTAANTLTISNALFAGVGTGGAILFSQQKTASGTTFLVSSFDGLAVGWRSANSAGQGSAMTITSIEVSGQSTVDTTPPDIVTEPVNATVPYGASCAFWVGAQSTSVMSYQWHRYGTNLVNGGNITGATSDMLVISPVSAADVASLANGYYVTVTDPGGSTNSVKCSLAQGTASSLVWSGSGTTWDLGVSSTWLSGANPATFNYGDTVTFDDVGGGGAVNLIGSYLSAASAKVDHTLGFYTFQGTGSFAGPGNLIYTGSAQLTLNNGNTFSGGTLISNATANLRLGNLRGLGTGPITLAQGQMSILVAASASTGIASDLIVADNFTLVVDPVDTAYAVVLNGSLSGTSGKMLTINHGSNGSGTNVTRIRASGPNTVYNANLNLNDSTFLWACYQSAPATYDGVISGTGALMQKNSTTYLNGLNTYSGGTTPAAGAIGLGTNSIGDPVTSGPIGTGPLLLINDSTTSLTGSGTIFASGGPRTIANVIQCPTGSNNLTLVIGGTNNLTLSGAFTLQGNDGGGAGTNRIIQADAFTTLSGVISDGGLGVGLIKTGTNVLLLSNSETYTGPTTVSAGTLQVNGSLAAGSAVTVNSNATLAGIGTVGGNVTVNAGGAIAPGTSIGTLNIGGNLSLAGNLLIEVNRSGLASDRINVTGTLANTGTGTVTVSNTGTALQPGDTFTVFSNNKALGNGGALTVTGGGVIWNNRLAIDGTIQVQSAVATTPGNISYSLSGLNLTLSWPPNYLTWVLQSNSVGVASSASWFPVPGSQTSTQMVFPIIPARTNVFYRLLRP